MGPRFSALGVTFVVLVCVAAGVQARKHNCQHCDLKDCGAPIDNCCPGDCGPGGRRLAAAGNFVPKVRTAWAALDFAAVQCGDFNPSKFLHDKLVTVALSGNVSTMEASRATESTLTLHTMSAEGKQDRGWYAVPDHVLGSLTMLGYCPIANADLTLYQASFIKFSESDNASLSGDDVSVESCLTGKSVPVAVAHDMTSLADQPGPVVLIAVGAAKDVA